MPDLFILQFVILSGAAYLFRLTKFRWCMPNRRLLIVLCCCSPACHNFYRFVFRPTFTEGSYPLSLALGQFLFYRRVRTVTRHSGFIKAQPINGAIGFCRNGAKILLLFVPIMVGRGGVEPPFSVFQTGAPTVYATCPYRKSGRILQNFPMLPYSQASQCL